MTKTKEFLTVQDICVLFKEQLNVRMRPTGIYHYIKIYDFPANTGWGRPRVWEADKVKAWFVKSKSRV